MQNIRLKSEDPRGGEFQLFNGYFFRNLDDVALYWEITRNGLTVQSGEIMDLNVLPQDSTGISLPFNGSFKESGSYYLNASFRLKKPEIWAPKGYEIAREQFILTSSTQKTVP